MRVNIINNARKNFRDFCNEHGTSWSAGCWNYLNEAWDGVDPDDDWDLIKDRVFEGNKFGELLDWLREAKCSNPPQYKADMVKAFQAMLYHGSEKTTIGGCVKDYEAANPTRTKSTRGRKAKKGKAATTSAVKYTIDQDALLQFVIANGMTKAGAQKIVTKEFCDGLVKLIKVA